MKPVAFLLLLFLSAPVFGQLGFCEGSKGDAIFHQSFDKSDTLLPGVTSYTYTSGVPNDGEYTISNGVGLNSSWHPNFPSLSSSNDQVLVINANDNTAGRFFRTEIPDLCPGTTYEFSAFLMNIYDPRSGVCPGELEIPINVRFEIWDASDTVLLKEGSTGDIYGTNSPQWEQFALTFQSKPGQESVILKMFNNGQGGCGNDLAIDEIEFRSCGDFTKVANEETESNGLQLCEEETPASLHLRATSDGNVYSQTFYQWQESPDDEVYTDITGETGIELNISSLSASTYYRVKVAENMANLLGNECSSASEPFYIEIVKTPEAPRILKNEKICSNETNPGLTAQAASDESISWFDAPTGGNLLAENTDNYIPTTSGTYYAEARKTNTNCTPSPRTGATLTIFEAPEADDKTLQLCPDSSIILQAEVDDMTYQWSSGATTASISVDAPGSYSVEIICPNSCSTTQTFEVKGVESPEIREITSQGQTLNIKLATPGDFEFSLDGITYQQSGIFTNLSGGVYTAYVRNLAACTPVTRDFAHVVVPEVLTPNNDGYNDYFEIKGLNFFGSSQIRIFDRYGRIMYSQTNSDVQWDGTMGGQLLPSDDYWYELRIEGFEARTGHFSLVR